MNVGNIEKYRTSAGWRYRVRWSLPSGERRSKSFKLRRDADGYLRQIEADRMRGVVTDPRGSDETLFDYSKRWLDTRSSTLAPRTVELYRSELNKWIVPTFGALKLSAITTERVRMWHGATAAHSSPITAAKCYRLLRTILGTAEADGLLPRNPCQVKGAGHERAGERPLLTPEQVHLVADEIDPRYRALILLAAYGSLRRGELLALQRRHVNEVRSTISVEGQAQHVAGQGRVIRTTKSDAGRRAVAVPAAVLGELLAHMNEYTGQGADDWVFTAERGGPAREADLGKAWKRAAAACDVHDTHLHDLRHFGGTLAAQSGATLRELQSRLGHSTARAAMIYQHATEDRDRLLADRLGEHFSVAQEAAVRRLG
ncbi:MAG: site-specific integrase [Planctomycetes bacterium]|jgi:integrase|nr:site-specific integrase [Planctomycetota bacterium]